MTNAFYSHIKNSQWIYPVLLIGSALAVYFPILGNDFLYYWDDQWQVTNQYTEGGWKMLKISMQYLPSLMADNIRR